MNIETRRILTLLLSLFIIVSAFIPALSPLPAINNSDQDYSLFETFTNSLNPSNPSPLEKWFDQLAQDLMRDYASDYLLVLGTILFAALGILLIMLLIGVIITILNKNAGSFIRVTAILNTVVYIAIILLTYYQANKLVHERILSYFIKIAPSIGAWIGLISSLVLIFVSGYGSPKTEMTSVQSSQNVMYPSQNPYPQNAPAASVQNTAQPRVQAQPNMQEQTGTQAQPAIQAQSYAQTQSHIQAQPHIQAQSHVQAQAHIQTQSTSGYNFSTRPEDTQNRGEIEIARLGNGYVSTGASKSTGVTLTDKRLYLSGELFKSDVGGNLRKTTSTHVVDLQDIVGTEFRHKKKTGLLVTSIILFVFNILLFFAVLSGTVVFVSMLNTLLFIVAIGIFITYLNKSVTLFVVNTRTGSIGFNVRFAGQAAVERFAESIQAAQRVLKVQQGISMGVY